MPIGPTLLWPVPGSPSVPSFSESITCSSTLGKGASPVIGFFSVHKAPDGPCPEPLPRQGVATCWARVSHSPLGAWDQAPLRRLRGCFSCCGLDQHGGSLQWVVAAAPCVPEDALLTLLPLSRDGVEVLAIKVGVATGPKPPATCGGQKKGSMFRRGPWISTGAGMEMR